MRVSCRDLISFVDGELAPETAEAFRSHLRTCAACQSGLVKELPLGMHLESLGATLAQATQPVRLAGSVKVAARPTLRSGGPRKARVDLLQRIAGGPYVPLAAAVLAVVFIPSLREAVMPPTSATNPFVHVTSRPNDTKLALGAAAGHRPRDEKLGQSGIPRGRISHDDMAALAKTDKHALAIAMMWNGDNLGAAAELLSALVQTPSVRSDRVALEIVNNTKTDNVEWMLAELEALQHSNDRAAVSAARWNYALLLARLGLTFSAAKVFSAIASDGEAGWADEARQRAAAAELRGRDARDGWESARRQGEALVKTGAPVSPDVVQRFPGLMRAYFYQAVRAAPSRERVLALEPLAAELDRVDGQSVLGDHVRRIANADFRRRAPLASAYRRILDGEPIAPEIQTALTTPTGSGDVFDIIMGAMIALDVEGADLEGFERMVKQAGDPWFEIMLASAAATADRESSRWLDAEARLLKARKLCSPAIRYQCLRLEQQLGELYQSLHRVPEAIAVLQGALHAANSSGEWGTYSWLLPHVADIERFHSSAATARAYANEVLVLSGMRPRERRSAHLTLAGAALLDVDGPTARRELDAAQAPPDAALDLPAANYLTDIARLDPRPDDLARLLNWLSAIRADDKLTPAQRVFADEIEGRLLIEHDRTAGIALLERAIAATRGLPHDVLADKVRAGAYSVLVFDAARHNDHARSMALIAEELDLPRPSTCAVALVAEDERAVVVVRGADGKDRATYERRRGPRAGMPAISAELARTLDGCDHVQVLANAMLQGQPRALPPTLAWSYATGGRRRVLPAAGPPPAAHAVVVTDVTPPADLRLPTLLPRAVEPARSIQTLSGPAATPARVLAAMRDATEIQFHTHALVDLAVSDASHLVLSSGPDGRYALTAESIRSIELRGRPIIVLSACHSAQGARYQHAPWSLPHAFLTVGARAVFAAGTAIPDNDAWRFFARVLQRVRSGATPAAALRDERVIVLASDPSSWVADVIVFE